MRAVVQHRYGGPEVLRLEEIEPPELAPDRIVVRVCAASVNALDWHLLRGKPILARLGAGWRSPKQPVRGADLAGVVEAVGRDVTRFRVGDEVYGTGIGTFAELALASERGLAQKPPGVSFEAAAAVPVAGRTALQGLRARGGLVAGQRVLIDGAGGGVGTFAVQIARALGAEVTAITSRDKVELVGSLGADRVLVHADVPDLRRDPARYDVVFDVGGFRGADELAAVTVPGGTVVVCGAGANAAGWIGPLSGFLARRLRPRIGDVRVLRYLTSLDPGEVADLAGMVERGEVVSAIDRVYPLAETAAAVAQVEDGRAAGKVVVAV